MEQKVVFKINYLNLKKLSSLDLFKSKIQDGTWGIVQKENQTVPNLSFLGQRTVLWAGRLNLTPLSLTSEKFMCVLVLNFVKNC